MGIAISLELPRRSNTAAHVPAVDIPCLLGPSAWRRLNPAIQRRFDSAHGKRPVSYPGRMRFERSSVGLLFAIASRLFGSPLPTRRAMNCPMTVAVSRDAAGGVVWDRKAQMSAQLPVNRIISTKRMGRDGHLLECVRGGLGMELDVYEDAGALVFASRRYFLNLGPVRLPIPHLLSPGRCAVRHSDEGPHRFRFTLSMRHPIWGTTFHQTGVFTDPESET